MTRSYPPPEWRYRTEPRRGAWVGDVLIIAMMVAALAVVVELFSGG